MIEFLLNKELQTLEYGDPNLSVLDWLRTEKALVGTKEGCGSGDCGACTVTLVELSAAGDGLYYRSINSCLTLMANLHGKQLITVDHLKPGHDADLHPVQQAMVDCHASQCGFCTPGIVMSLYTLYESAAHNSEVQTFGREQIEQALGGNLCRCTGYRPIIDAANQVLGDIVPTAADPQVVDALQKISPGGIVHQQVGQQLQQCFVPAELAEVLQLKADYPAARYIAGGTDLTLEISQQHKTLPQLISLQGVGALQRIEAGDDGSLFIGAAASYSDFESALFAYCPESEELIVRLGSRQVRNTGTLGGSLGNASPIGDPAPLLMALDAQIKLTSATGSRLVAVNEFFTAYRQTVADISEVIEGVSLPPRKDTSASRATDFLRAFKVSKRYEDDISTVCAVFLWQLSDDGSSLGKVRLCFGGVAATPLRASRTEALMLGQPLTAELVEQASLSLSQELNPISDVRASADYRRQLAGNLLQRAWLQYSHSLQSDSNLITRVHQYA